MLIWKSACNILVQDIEGVFTLENYGRNVNCSLMTIFYSKIRLMYLSSGVHHRTTVRTFSHPRVQSGINHKVKQLFLNTLVNYCHAFSQAIQGVVFWKTNESLPRAVPFDPIFYGGWQFTQDFSWYFCLKCMQDYRISRTSPPTLSTVFCQGTNYLCELNKS